jgi:ankyrin repeat protein
VHDATGKTALHYLLNKRSEPKYLRLFLEHGARIDIADKAGTTVVDIVSRIRDERFRAALKAGK